MRLRFASALGMLLAIGIAPGALANDGILARLHRHGHGDCEANASVVHLPAQQIRIETSRPRVIVNEFSGTPRGRGYFPGHAFAPLAGGPFVATFVPHNFGVTTFGSSGS